MAKSAVRHKDSWRGSLRAVWIVSSQLPHMLHHILYFCWIYTRNRLRITFFMFELSAESGHRPFSCGSACKQRRGSQKSEPFSASPERAGPKVLFKQMPVIGGQNCLMISQSQINFSFEIHRGLKWCFSDEWSRID